MPQKIFDILPPKEKKYFYKNKRPASRREVKADFIARMGGKPLGEDQPSENGQNLPVSDSPTRREESQLAVGRQSKGFPRLFFALLSVILLLAAGFLTASAFASAVVDIRLAKEDLKFKSQIIADKEKAQPDFSKNILPAKIIEEEKSVSKDFLPSGKVPKSVKARGAIRVYNNYSSANQPIMTGTRFVSTEGKLFKSIRGAIIPGAQVVSGKLTPSFVDVDVEAAEGGDEYNINPSTFSIPGFAGTPKYTAFYGKSFVQMNGGFVGEISRVIQKDLDDARNSLLEEAKTAGKKSLESKNSGEFVLLNRALLQETLETKSSVPSQTEVESFNYTVKIKSKWVVFNKSDIEDFSNEGLKALLPPDKVVQEGTLDINYNLDSVDFEKGTITVSVDAVSRIYPLVDELGITQNLVGKSLKEARAFLENQPQILNAKISVKPFWSQRIPDTIEKVKIKVSID